MSDPQRVDPRQRFIQIVSGSRESIDLAEAALWIAAERYPDLDVDAYTAGIDALAERVRPRVETASSDSECVAALNDFLFGECGFRGNEEDYYDPRNSYLNELLDRRLGIPITLAILWVSVAQRLGLSAHGVGFPGHFLASVPPILVDCFAGRVISPKECQSVLEQHAGRGARLEARMFAETSSLEILARLLRNLKHIFMRDSQITEALACADRIVILQPDIADEIRDRGLLYRALECWSDARTDFERYLELAPEAEDAGTIRSLLARMGDRETRLH